MAVFSAQGVRFVGRLFTVDFTTTVIKGLTKSSSKVEQTGPLNFCLNAHSLPKLLDDIDG